MRFRPLGKSEMVVSSISLALSDRAPVARPADWKALIYAAFENGINAFEVSGDSPGIIEGLSQAMRAVDRRLVYVGLRVGVKLGPAGSSVRDFSAEALNRTVDAMLARSSLGYLDAVILDDPQTEEFSPQALEQLNLMRADGRARMLGVAGQDNAIDALLTTRAFDVFYLPFSLTSGWVERRRMKTAADRDMGIFTYDYFPKTFQNRSTAPSKSSASERSRASPLADAGTYAFLDRTRNWTAEEICLAYALCEPSLASVQISAARTERIDALAAVPDRELPPGVSAQIEMARFGMIGGAKTASGA
jgi:aryl-alcohol dehydrogenase-like predicted oxidoreductase